MSSKISSTVLSSSTAYAAYKPTFLSLRILQSQCPPPNPARPPLHFLLPALQPRPAQSTFTTTSYREKKSGGKQDSKSPPPNLPVSKAEADPHDLSEYKEAIAKSHEQLKAGLARVKPGGIVRDLEALEGVRVQLEKDENKSGKGSGVKLGDLAQVLRRGKNVVLLVGEKDVSSIHSNSKLDKAVCLPMLTSDLLSQHVKPISSSLVHPPHNLNPQPSPTEPLTLMIPLPPITQESRQEAAKVAAQKGEAALFALREARGAH